MAQRPGVGIGLCFPDPSHAAGTDTFGKALYSNANQFAAERRLAMTAKAALRLSFDDWLAIERAAMDQRSGFVAGEVLAMTGATEGHNLIVAHVIR